MSGHCCCSSCCQTSWAERSVQRWGPVLSSWWRSKANPPCTLSPEGKHRSQSKKYWQIDSSLDYCSASLKHCIKPSLTVWSQIWGRKKNQTRSGQSLTTRTCELHSLELPLHVFAHQDDLLFSPVALQLLLKPWRQLQLVTGWFYRTRREDLTWNSFTCHPSIHDPWDGNAPEHNNVNIVPPRLIL